MEVFRRVIFLLLFRQCSPLPRERRRPSTHDRSDGGGRHPQRITALCRGRKRGGRKMVVMEERRKLVMDGRGGDEAPRKHRRGEALGFAGEL